MNLRENAYVLAMVVVERDSNHADAFGGPIKRIYLTSFNLLGIFTMSFIRASLEEGLLEFAIRIDHNVIELQ